MTDLPQFSVNLPDQVTIQYTTPGITQDTPKPSYIDLDITGGTTLDGVYDAYCIDTDLGFEENITYTANVFSSYEPLPPEIVGPGEIEFPENLDLVNWILNQCFVGKTSEAGGNFTFGDVQRAIWELMDDENSTSGLGFFSQARADEIVALAMANGEGFVPSFEYETIFGEQVTGKLAVILAPDDNGDIVADHQIVVAEVPLSRIGDFVFLDDNEDGIQDTGEGGLAGVTVNLLADVDGDGVIEDGEVVATTTTDANGEYQFDVIAGDYKVQFVQPPGFEVSPRNQGMDDTVDSDGLISDLISVPQGQENPTIDQGFFFTSGGGNPVGSIGDTIFQDNNANGVQDGLEDGFEGVTVELIDKGADGQIGGGDDTLIQTQTTDQDGKYLFENLVANSNYAVVVTDENNVLDGFVQTADPDSDLDNMSMVDLAPGQNNLDQDFGYRALDYGDAPDTYGTTNGNNGASHVLSNGQTSGTPIIKLGNLVDTELDGQPTVNADGDDLNPETADDEDGVTFSNLQAG